MVIASVCSHSCSFTSSEKGFQPKDNPTCALASLGITPTGSEPFTGPGKGNLSTSRTYYTSQVFFNEEKGLGESTMDYH